jgi:anaerobic ribonucleoside-triphosphate reductase
MVADERYIEPEEADQEAVEVKVPCEVYSRIVGYLRPVQAWNQGKQQEFTERTVFKVDAAEESDV